MNISIKGLDKAEVLAALYNNSQPLGMGFLAPGHSEQLSVEVAKAIIRETDDLYFDYLRGRVMKVDLNGDEFDPRLYDRDNGSGAAQRALAPLLETA